MALVDKSHGKAALAFPLSSPFWTTRRILKALGFLTLYILVFFGLGFAFRHGYWVAGLWSAAAVLAWVFMRGAAEASLPSAREPWRKE
jgi:hypothetical protein